MDKIIELFSHGFIVNAVIVGVLVSLCASLLGVTLILKRYSMIGDGLSHIGFGTLSVAVAFNWSPMFVSVPVVVISAFLLLRISENSKIKGDAAIALISSAALAIGITVTSLSKGMNSDVLSYMFGSILAMEQSDVVLSVVLSLIVILIFIMFYNNIFSITFDENFSKATGSKTAFLKMILAFSTAITVVIGMRIMGTLLISGLIIFPTLTSMRVFKSFKSVIISSSIISVSCFVTGIFCSYFFSIPVGASIVIVNALTFVFFVLLGIAMKR